MFNRKLKKEIEDLRVELNAVAQKHEWLRERVVQMGCDHWVKEYRVASAEFYSDFNNAEKIFAETCRDCGKFFGHVTEKEKARRMYESAKRCYNEIMERENER